MNKTKAARLAGFVGALCATGALVGAGVQATGAYFTDSHTGTINASTGQIKVSISPSSGTLNFTDLLPGNYKTQTVDYTAHPKGGTEDIWLVFPTGGSAAAFTSTPQPGNVPLGEFGHFALSSTGGAHFTSYNLANPGDTPPHTGPVCPTNANGWGGSNAQQDYPDGPDVAFCAPKNAILLQSNMGAGASGHVNLTFGFTPKLSDPAAQNQSLAPVVKYQIVATQHGVRPDNS